MGNWQNKKRRGLRLGGWGSLLMVMWTSLAGTPVEDATALREALEAAAPGEWRDVDIHIQALGTAERPITLEAAVALRVAWSP